MAGEASAGTLRVHPEARQVAQPGLDLFSILTSKALRHRSFENLRALDRAIYEFAHHWNRTLARPFDWTYTGKVLNA